jgi:hypothetical protein
LSITFPMVRNAVKPLDLSEIRGGVRNMGILRYRQKCLKSLSCLRKHLMYTALYFLDGC